MALLALTACTVATPPDPASSAAASPRPSPVSAPPAPTFMPSPSIEPDPTEYAPPAPKCPGPSTAVVVPDVTASVAGAPPVIGTPGSSTFSTCSTTAVSDAIPPEPRTTLHAGSSDRVLLEVPPGWRILRWKGSDHPAAGEGANVWPPVDLAEPDRRIDVPVPIRRGASIAAYTLWLESSDERIVGTLEVQIRIEVGG